MATTVTVTTTTAVTTTGGEPQTTPFNHSSDVQPPQPTYQPTNEERRRTSTPNGSEASETHVEAAADPATLTSTTTATGTTATPSPQPEVVRPHGLRFRDPPPTPAPQPLPPTRAARLKTRVARWPVISCVARLDWKSGQQLEAGLVQVLTSEEERAVGKYRKTVSCSFRNRLLVETVLAALTLTLYLRLWSAEHLLVIMWLIIIVGSIVVNQYLTMRRLLYILDHPEMHAGYVRELSARLEGGIYADQALVASERYSDDPLYLPDPPPIYSHAAAVPPAYNSPPAQPKDVDGERTTEVIVNSNGNSGARRSSNGRGRRRHQRGNGNSGSRGGGGGEIAMVELPRSPPPVARRNHLARPLPPPSAAQAPPGLANFRTGIAAGQFDVASPWMSPALASISGGGSGGGDGGGGGDARNEASRSATTLIATKMETTTTAKSERTSTPSNCASPATIRKDVMDDEDVGGIGVDAESSRPEKGDGLRSSAATLSFTSAGPTMSSTDGRSTSQLPNASSERR